MIDDVSREGHEVFISYSTADKTWADAVCATLEGVRVRCWVAPRDILPGTEWGAAIVEAIESCRVMVLVFSAHANQSPQVRREVERAISKGVAILPFRVEDIVPDGAMGYALGNTHWLDAFTPPVECQMAKLSETVQALLGEPRARPVAAPPKRRYGRAAVILAGVAVAVATAICGAWVKFDGDRQGRGAVAEKPAAMDCTPTGGVAAAEVRGIQAAWAKHLGREVEETVEVSGGVKMTFVLVPPGKFRMGSPKSEEGRRDDEALHSVSLTEPFYLAKYPVTQRQYEALTGKNPSHFKGTDNPADSVSHGMALEYAALLTRKGGDKHAYRLPTEAEWEYACRAGRPVTQPFGVGDGLKFSSSDAKIDILHPYGGGKIPSNLDFDTSTSGVGSYSANALGLYDMQGNVWQWCADWYGPYALGDTTNPVGASEEGSRVLRGGAAGGAGSSCRAAIRFPLLPGTTNYYLGFRLARDISPGSK